jgi:hypothetical protein
MAAKLNAIAQRVLRILQFEPGDGWIDMDRLIENADIYTPDDDLDTRINAVTTVLDQLEAAGYETEMQREEAGDFYRLARE